MFTPTHFSLSYRSDSLVFSLLLEYLEMEKYNNIKAVFYGLQFSLNPE